MKTPPKIAIFGVFGVGNFGNEATLESYLSLLRNSRPDAAVVCICARPEKVIAEYGIPATPMDSVTNRPTEPPVGFAQRILRRIQRIHFVGEARRWWKTLTEIRGCDTLVVPGTGILDDFGTSPDGLPYHLFRWCVAARLCRVRVCFISIGAGPIVDIRSRRLMTWAARLASRRSFRDQESKDFVRNLGVNTEQDAVTPDLVFRYPLKGRSFREQPGKRVRIGLGVMNYFGWRGHESEGRKIFADYIGKMTRFARWLVESGYAITLLIGEDNDRQAVDVLLQNLRADIDPNLFSSVSTGAQSSMADFLESSESVEVLVVTRFHNVVGALALGKPVISIAYASKNDRLMEDFSLGAYCQQIEDLDVQRLIEQFGLILDRKQQLSGEIAAKAAKHRRFFDENWPDLS